MLPSHLSLTIDLQAVARNFLFLKNRASFCAPVLKANAYHCGANVIGQTLWDCGARMFFVAYIEEALSLKKHLPDARIFVLNGPYGQWDWPRFFKHHDFIPVINTLEDFYHLSSQDFPLEACLHVDTGMNRLGMPWKDYESIWPRCQGFRYVMSHLSSAETLPPHESHNRQKRIFDTIKARHPHALLSLANSAGIFLGYSYDMIRPGMALYGLNPIPYTQNPLTFALEAKVRILQIQHLQAGDCVGYNETFKATSPMHIATLACGYADGLPLPLQNGGSVLIHGKKAPLVGKISMDLMTVDVTSIYEAKVGAWATLFNARHSLDLWAKICGWTPHALLTGFLSGKRLKKYYIKDAQCSQVLQQSVI